MAGKQVFIRHIFNGGWATDLGDVAFGLVPGDDGIVRVPFLAKAEDAVFDLDGSLRKPPGLSKLNSVAIESGADIKSLYDYWSGSTQHRMVFSNGKILDDDADGTFASIITGLTSTERVHFNSFDDFLIIAITGGTAPKSWDGTTAQALAGSPPNFAFSVTHHNRVFAAGNPAAPHLLYYCDIADPENWTTGDAGSIQIDPGDGDVITGLASNNTDLFIFKGPYKGSIHRLTGTSNSDFAKTIAVRGVGAVDQRSIFNINKDIGFLWSDGSVRMLSATDTYGDYIMSSPTVGIQTYLSKNLRWDLLAEAVAAVDDTKSRVLIAFTADGATENNRILAIDFRFNPPRPSLIKSVTALSLASVIDSASNNERIVMVGGTDGFVRKWNSSTISNDGTAFNYNVQTPYMDYGVPQIMKTLHAGAIGTEAVGGVAHTFGWSKDNGATKTQSVTVSSSGSTLDSFVLDTDTLAGATFIDKFFSLEEGGEFRNIALSLQDSTNNEDTIIRSLTSAITFGSVSLE